MINLQDLTIMIPVKIESNDRYNNLRTVLSYLDHHFKTNVSIIEAGQRRFTDFLTSFNNLNICYEFVKTDDGAFHRTKYLNEMICHSKTPIISNYDCDVLLPVSSYIVVVDKLLNENIDFIYPYKKGVGQKRLFYSEYEKDPVKKERMSRFLSDLDLSLFDNDINTDLYNSFCGHSLFAKRSSYISAFMENENFISYGPEDQERLYRFEKLGYTVEWYNDYVYHLEHLRTEDSWITNRYFKHNCDLFEKVKSMSRQEIINIYKEYDYLQKYK